MRHDPELAVLHRALRQEAFSWLWFAGPLLIVGLSVALLGARTGDRLAVASGVLLTAAGAVLLLRALRNPRRAPLYRAVYRTPELITALQIVYTSYDGKRPRPVLHVCLRSGRRHQVRLPDGSERRVLAGLRRRAPRAA